jgi:hypothetical protein
MSFSIREIMLVTVIVALAVAWWVDRQRMREEVRREVERVYSVLDNRAAALNPPQK